MMNDEELEQAVKEIDRKVNLLLGGQSSILTAQRLPLQNIQGKLDLVIMRSIRPPEELWLGPNMLCLAGGQENMVAICDLYEPEQGDEDAALRYYCRKCEKFVTEDDDHRFFGGPRLWPKRVRHEKKSPE